VTHATTALIGYSANRRRKNLNQNWSGILIRTFGLIRMSVGSVPKCCGCIILSASVISPSMVQNRSLTAWEMVTNGQKSPIPQWWRKWKVIRNPHADPDQHQKLITSRRSPLARACQVWSTSVSAIVSYPVYRMTDGIWIRIFGLIRIRISICRICSKMSWMHYLVGGSKSLR